MVDSEWQKNEAEKVAREVCFPGVTRIVNKLTVNPNRIPPFPV